MTRVVSLRSSTDRYVLLMESPATMYRRTFDGHQRQRVQTQFEKFLVEATPESALRPEAKFPSPLRQLKDRGGNVRALGVWCQGEGYDLFVTVAIYDKSDEDSYLSKQAEFAEYAGSIAGQFDDREQDEIAAKAQEWRTDPDLVLITPEDL